MVCSSALTIKQGDAYSVVIRLSIGGTLVDAPATFNISKVEFSLAELEEKYYKSDGTGTVTFSTDKSAFLYPLTQTESFSLEPGEYFLDMRVVFSTGDVIGLKKIKKIRVVPAKSDEVL